ncbi:MAG: cell wall hydrolase [Gammaproteobacteria bacterium]
MSSKSTEKRNKCSEGKYWVGPYTRKRIDKFGKSYTQHVKGYCSRYHTPFHEIAEKEKMMLDHLYFALTVYGEARGENTASKQAIAWIIQNRFDKSSESSYQKVVHRKTQFSCWMKGDKNYEKLRRPGEASAADKKSWEEIKKIIEEVRNAPKNKNPIPGVYNYFSGKPKKKWETHYFDLPGVKHFHFVKFK